MAEYAELVSLKNDDALKNKVEAAIADWGVRVRAEGAVPDHDKRVTLATRTLGKERQQSDQIWLAVLMANKAASVAAIQGATDAALQTNVDTLMDALALDLKAAGTD